MSSSNKLLIYKEMEDLSLALEQELNYDMKIQSCGIFNDITLPAIAASVFCKATSIV